MNGHAWRERIPAFVLGELDAETTAALEKHLEGCSRCRDEVEAYREFVSGLASLAPASGGGTEPGAGGERPPPARALSARRARRRPAAESDGGQSSLRLPGPPRGHDGPRVPAAVAWLAAAAGVTVALIAGAAYWEARSASENLRLDYQQALARVEQLEAARAERDSMLATLRGDELRTAALSGSGEDPRVRLFWNPGRGRLLIAAFDLPPAAAGRTYQLWGLSPDRDPVGLATFQTGNDGFAVVAREVGRGERFERSAVTEEPAGGSPAPTTTPFLVGAWESGDERPRGR